MRDDMKIVGSDGEPVEDEAPEATEEDEQPPWIYRLGDLHFDNHGRAVQEKITVAGDRPEGETRYQGAGTWTEKVAPGVNAQFKVQGIQIPGESIEEAYANFEEAARPAVDQQIKQAKAQYKAQSGQALVAANQVPPGRPRFNGRGGRG